MSSAGSKSEGSLGGSSRGSNWSASSTGSRTVSHTWTEEFPLFPLLAQLETTWDPRLSALGFFFLLLQPLGLVLNTAYDWGNVMHYPNKGFYFIHFPFWDPTYVESADSRKMPCMVFFWMIFAVLCGGYFLLMLVFRTKGEQQFDPRIMQVLRCGVHALGGVAHFPVMHMLLVFCVCDPDTKKLRTFDEECWGAWHVVHFAVACISLAAVFLISLGASTLLYHTNPSPSLGLPLARAHTHVDFADTLYRTALAVLYHVLFAYGQKDVFPIILCALTFLLLVYSCFKMPYYFMLTHKVRTGLQAVTVWAALLAAIGPSSDDSFHDQNLSTVALLAGGLLFFLIGFIGATVRRDGQCHRALCAAAEGDLLTLARIRRERERLTDQFPRYLPPADMTFSPHRAIMADFNAQMQSGGQSESSAQNSNAGDDMDILVPFVSSVLQPTDVELATRVMREYVVVTGLGPSSKMQLYAFRIFTKGMVKYTRDPLVSLHFSFFMTYFAGGLAVPDVSPVVPCVRAALKESEQLMDWEADFDTLYQAHKLQSVCKPIIGMTNDAHRKVTTAANRIHKDILGHMSDFWKRLLGDKVDTLHLAAIANKVTERREEGMFQFKKALQHPTLPLYRRYAQFLRQVMLDSDSAEMIDQRLHEMSEKRKDRSAGGADAAFRADLGELAADSELQSKSFRRGFRTSTAQREQQSTTIARLSVNMNVMFALVFLVLAGFFIFEAVQANEKKHKVDQIEAAGRVRVLAAQAGVIAQQMWYHVDTQPRMLVGSDLELQTLQQELRDAATEFLETHNSLTHGKLKTDYSTHIEFYKTALCEVVEYPSEGEPQRTLTPLWNLGNQYGNALLDIATAANGRAAKKDFQFIEANLRDSVGPCFNRSMVYYEQAATDAATQTIWVMAGLFVVSLLLVFVVYVTMALNFQKIGAAKLGTLNLFTLIPRVHLEKLYDEAKARVEGFDAADDDDAGAGEGQGALDSLMPRRRESQNGSEQDDQEGGGEKTEDADRSENAQQERQDGAASQGDGEKEEKDDESGDAGEGRDAEISENEADHEEHKQGARRTAQQDERAPLILLVAVAVTLFALGAIGIVLVFLVDNDLKDSEDRRVAAADRMDLIHDYYRILGTLSTEARLYSQFGDISHLVRYWDILASGQLAHAHQRLVRLSSSEAGVKDYIRARQAVDDLRKTQRASQALTANAYRPPDGDMTGLLRDVTWNVSNWVFSDLTKYDGYIIREPLYALTDRTEDIARDSSYKERVARAVVFDDQYNADLDRARSSLDSAQHRDPADTDPDIGLIVAALVFNAVLLIGSGATLFITARAEGIARQRWLRAMLLILFVVCAGSVTVLGFTLREARNVQDSTDTRAVIAELINRTRVSVETLREKAMGFAQFGDRLYYQQYVDYYRSQELEGAIDDAQRFDPQIDFSRISEAFETLDAVLEAEKKALFLTASAHSRTRPNSTTTVISDAFSWVQDHRYNVSSAGDYARIQAEFGRYVDSGLVWTDQVQDASRTKEEKERMARFAVAGTPYIRDSRLLMEQLLGEVRTAFDRAESKLEDEEHLLETMSAVAIGCGVVSLFILLVYGIAVLVQVLQIISGKGRHDVLFVELTQRCRVALIFVALMLTGLFSVTFVNHDATKSIVPNNNYASAREWLVAESMYLVQRLFQDCSQGDCRIPAHERFVVTRQLYSAKQAIVRNRDQFYFDGGQYNVPTKHKAQDVLMFGPETAAENSFSCPNTQSGQPDDFLIARGNDLAMHRWLQILGDFSSYPILGREIALRTRNEVVEFEKKLYTALSESSALHAKNGKDVIDQASLVFFLLLSAIVVVVFLEYVFIFRPMVRMLRKEEEGTNLMLTMIPKDIQETVPAIAEYLSTGVITQNEKVQEVDAAIVEFSAVPTITIDRSGTILQFSRASVDNFGWQMEEVMGKNIKMLMPEEYSVRHDGFLAAYERTGIKKVIDKTRRVRAMRKDSSTFPVEITVREVRKTGMEPIYIGRLRDISQDLQFENERAVGAAVIRLSSTPIICIDTYGQIVQFSRAAEQLFGITQGQLLQQQANIKLLQPMAVASQHDGYLERYRRTRRKNVVDSARRVRARRINGTEFECEILVRELFNGSGQSEGFAGYLRDCTEENQLKFAASISNAIVEISPVPMVSITQTGIVKSFSPAAERDWGYSAGDVVGRNIKMLMPEEIARNHDGYLQKYLRTGEKRVINNIRVVQGRRSDGALFPCEVSVREVRQGADQMFYLGYIRDVSHERGIVHRARVRKTMIDLSPLPIAIINEIGTITTFNEAACELYGFRREEVIGNNVKMLQPVEVQKNHDMYLRRYIETGVKHIVDTTRRVSAVRKDSSAVPIEIKVAEIVISATERIYIGYMRDCVDELRMQSANLINDVVTELSVTPIVAINDKGEVITFSRSAAVQFEWPVESIIGKNIKLLQPDEIAAKHDYYLSEYLRTGRKKVIDNLRRVFGKKKSGELFTCDILVREIREKGMPPIYIGSVRDVTDEIATAERSRLNETIINMSSVPFVAITQRGLVQMYNVAAERTFGYTADEVMNKNIKLLMPEEVARFHDGYLRAYLKTGKSTMLNTVREVVGKTKDDRPVPLEICVRELKLGTLNWYGGFARDCTYQHSLKQASNVKDAVIELNPVPIITIDAFGKILAFTQSAERELQLTKEEAVGENVKRLMPAEYAAKHDGFLKHYRKTGEKRVIDTVREVVAQRKDGTQYPCEISVRAVRDGTEEVYIGYLRNITKQKLILEKRKEGRTMVDLALTAFITIDQIGTIKMWSKRAAELWGYTEEEVLNQNIKMCMPEEYAKQHDGFLSRYMETGVKRVVDTTRRVPGKHKNGSTFPTQLGLREYKDEMGSTFIGQIRDIRAEYQLLQEQALAEAITEGNVTPIIAIESDGRIIKWNKAAAECFGYSKEETIGQNVKMLQPDSVAIQHDGYLEAYRVTRIKRVIDSVRTVSGKKSDGSEFPCEITVREVQQGQTSTYVGYVNSLEARFQMESASKIAADSLQLCVLSVITINKIGTVQKFNKAAEEHFGYEASEVIGQNVKMLTPENVARNHDQFLESYQRTGVKHVIDTGRKVQALRKNGTTFPAEITVKELKLDDGDALFIGYLRDLTDEHVLQQAYLVNDLVTSLTTVPMIAIDMTGSVLKFSNAAEEAFGWSVDEVLGKNVKVVMPDQVADKHDMYLQRYKETGKKTLIDTITRQVAMRRDGSVFTIEIQLKEIKSDQGAAASTFVAFARDTTEDDMVERTRATNEVLIDMSPIAIIRASHVGEIILFNSAATTLFGYEAEEVVSGNLKMLMPERVAKEHDGYLSRYLADGIKRVIDTTRRVPALRKDGEEVEVEIVVREVKLRDSKPQYVGYVQAIGRKIELERMKRLNDAVLDLAGVPIVVINHLGIVLRFTTCAEEVFGWKQDELLGKNVKLLMPDTTARTHDKRLEYYQKTRQKSVIDSTVTQTAKKKTGYEFAVELSVKEIRSDTGDIFIGFVKPKD